MTLTLRPCHDVYVRPSLPNILLVMFYYRMALRIALSNAQSCYHQATLFNYGTIHAMRSSTRIVVYPF